MKYFNSAASNNLNVLTPICKVFLEHADDDDDDGDDDDGVSLTLICKVFPRDDIDDVDATTVDFMTSKLVASFLLN